MHILGKREFYAQLRYRFTKMLEDYKLGEQEVAYEQNAPLHDYSSCHSDWTLSFKEEDKQVDNKSYSLGHIAQLDLSDIEERQLFVSAINLVCTYLDLCPHSYGCQQKSHEECPLKIVPTILKGGGYQKIGLVGVNEHFIKEMSGNLPLRVISYDSQWIGKSLRGINIENGHLQRDDVIDWCDLILCSGDTLIEGMIGDFLGEKPILFYGSTIKGTAALMHLKHYCP